MLAIDSPAGQQFQPSGWRLSVQTEEPDVAAVAQIRPLPHAGVPPLVPLLVPLPVPLLVPLLVPLPEHAAVAC